MKTVGKAKVAAIFLSLGGISIQNGAALSLRGHDRTQNFYSGFIENVPLPLYNGGMGYTRRQEWKLTGTKYQKDITGWLRTGTVQCSPITSHHELCHVAGRYLIGMITQYVLV